MFSSHVSGIQNDEAERAELQRALGWDRDLSTDPACQENLRNYITLQLASAGLLPPDSEQGQSMTTFSVGILDSLREKNRLLSEYRAPVDSRIEQFLNEYFADVIDDEPLRLPSRTLTLDRHGMAREMSLPAGEYEFKNDLVSSYRCFNGVLNNPRSDRRTTAGTFHVAEGGLPIPNDKRIVPKHVFAKLFRAAMTPPDELMTLPYMASSKKPSLTWVSLLLRPLVCPEVPGFGAQKTMETRFFAPGSLISN
ncbi:MAG: hypothetical protein ACF788_11235, partial [Novipirellula sp. JB048]